MLERHFTSTKYVWFWIMNLLFLNFATKELLNEGQPFFYDQPFKVYNGILEVGISSGLTWKLLLR